MNSIPDHSSTFTALLLSPSTVTLLRWRNCFPNREKKNRSKSRLFKSLKILRKKKLDSYVWSIESNEFWWLITSFKQKENINMTRFHHPSSTGEWFQLSLKTTLLRDAFLKMEIPKTIKALKYFQPDLGYIWQHGTFSKCRITANCNWKHLKRDQISSQATNTEKM